MESREKNCPSHSDRGWAWMVLVGACVNSFILASVGSSFSVLFTEIVSILEAKKSMIVLIASLQFGVSLVLGPVFSRLAAEYGYRLVVMTGGMLATGGMCLSYGAAELRILIGAYGLLTGMGTGMINTPSKVINGLYFNKKLSLATGLASTSGAVGALVGPLLCVKLIELYTWHGALIILAGMYLQTVAASALFRPIPKAAKEELCKRRGGYRSLMMPITDMIKLGVHCLNNVAMGFSAFIMVTFWVLYGMSQGLSFTRAAQMMSVISVSGAVGAFLVAATGDRPWFPRHVVFVLATLATAIVAFVFLIAPDAPPA
ncbi:PREDICTED: monocarboxylate transporter 13-like [Priapulus caudatus]|uniref:Monocarboxylate transporter 13-like n=1 Tax=Priapulus caudatus TaxID=37621 RepID=A0ABM1ETV7_PRICU|nr:PREDICTED: monocarboxylate transporter 13-like [Priapulus caudatus]